MPGLINRKSCHINLFFLNTLSGSKYHHKKPSGVHTGKRSCISIANRCRNGHVQP